MNKAELIRELHERMNKQVSMKDLDQIVETMFTIMSEKLKSGEEVQLADFGKRRRQLTTRTRSDSGLPMTSV
jgi:nucleoid DNA-binding protein